MELFRDHLGGLPRGLKKNNAYTVGYVEEVEKERGRKRRRRNEICAPKSCLIKSAHMEL